MSQLPHRRVITLSVCEVKMGSVATKAAQFRHETIASNRKSDRLSFFGGGQHDYCYHKTYPS